MYLKMTKPALLVNKVVTDMQVSDISFDEDDVAVSRASVDLWLSDKPDLSISTISLEDVDTLCKQANAWLKELKGRKFISLSRSQNALSVGFIIGDLITFHMELEKLLVTIGVVEKTVNA